MYVQMNKRHNPSDRATLNEAKQPPTDNGLWEAVNNSEWMYP